MFTYSVKGHVNLKNGLGGVADFWSECSGLWDAKTGSTARVCGDMGILNVKGPDGKWYPYTVIGIIEKPLTLAKLASAFAHA